MFDWFKSLFKSGAVDPEAGVVASQYSGIGKVQGSMEGTGEGWGNFSRQQYSQLGQALKQQAMAPTPNIIQGGLTSGFDQNWLAEQQSAGSANGQKI